MALDKDLRQEIATAQRDFLAPVWGGMLRHQDDTLMSRGGGKGLKIYDEIERDCHAYAVLQKRKMAVVSRPWVVDPASSRRDDKKLADLVRAQLAALAFDQLCLDLLDATLKGFAVGEIIWDIDGDEIVARAFKARNPRRFAFADDDTLRLLTPHNMMPGEIVPERKFVVHRFGAKDNNPYGLGLGTRLFWPVWFKRQGIQFWLTFADKFGSPTALGKYPNGTAPAEQKKLLDALAALANDSGVIVPEGMLIEFLEAERSGSVDTYEKLCRYMDEEISKATLGETLTTNMGSVGSRSASDTHNEVRLELTQADADLLSGTLNNSLVRWICDLNAPGATPPRVWRDISAPEDLASRATRDKTIVDMGFRPTLQYIRETYGGEWTGTGPVAPGVTPPGNATAFAEGADKTAAETYTEQLGAASAQAMDGLLAPVKKLVMTAGSLEEIRDGLLALYGEMDVADLAVIMQRALTAAELAGRYEAR